ncbi:MAG: hypothetical protein Q8M19_08180 [Reyranella sp.]|nr:hypothetical protein [Reyranella sp.]
MLFRLIPPPEIALAMALSLLLPILFAAVGKSWPSESILVQLAKSSALCLVLWLAAIRLIGIRVEPSAAIACLCILAIASMVLYVGVSLLAYSFRLETLLTVGRHPDGLTYEEVAATFGDGAGLSALSNGRIRTLELLGMIHRAGDTVEITPLGSFVAKLYGVVRNITNLV